MGLITSRLNLDSLYSNGRRRSQQGEEQLYSYSLNKNYFSNYFFMGGERFEVNDPDYLFGDTCDLNFLTCTKPYSLPYKKAQQNLLTHLNTKQKAINKVSSRVSSLSSPLNILTGRHRQVSQARKQDAQTQTLNGNNNNNRALNNGPEPSQPLVMLINIRKETLRLVKSSHACNLDSDQNSLTNTASISNTISEQSGQRPSHTSKDVLTPTSTKSHQSRVHKATSTSNRYSTTSSHATTAHPQDVGDGPSGQAESEDIGPDETDYRSNDHHDSDTSSITSNSFASSQSTIASTSTGKSGYTSVRDVPPSESDDGEYFEDALNEPTNLSTDNDSEKNQQKSLLRPIESSKETCDIMITIEDGGEDEVDGNTHSTCDSISKDPSTGVVRDKGNRAGKNSPGRSKASIKAPSAKILTKSRVRKSSKTSADKKQAAEGAQKRQQQQQNSNRVYKIEFTFDAEVDCSIRVSYFCTRVVSSNNVAYKPLHATYKSKTYTYKRGLNQKFEQQEHSFRPYLFDEDLLIYKPLDMDGNYNSGAVFPIVIHCVALEGPMPRQSQSLVATVEKSQLDDSYSIKPLKQMIFVDGVQYILQDIYGIENKPLTSGGTAAPRRTPRLERNLHSSCASLHSRSNLQNSNLNLSETGSIGSAVDWLNGPSNLGDSLNRTSLVSNQYRSLGSENTFECVICMSEERDTMLLPCRHMCLCSSCAQSLRYQSSSCPICRCPFKAALNIRFTRRSSGGSSSSDNVRNRSSNAIVETEHACAQSTAPAATVATSTKAANATDVKGTGGGKREQESSARRASLTNPATPLLGASKLAECEKENPSGEGRTRAVAHELPDGASPGTGTERMRVGRTGGKLFDAGAAATTAKTTREMAGASASAALSSLELQPMGKNSWKLGDSGAATINKGGAKRAEDDGNAASRTLEDSGNKCSSSRD